MHSTSRLDSWSITTKQEKYHFYQSQELSKTSVMGWYRYQHWTLDLDHQGTRVLKDYKNFNTGN